MDLVNALNTRKSVRAFLNKPVDEKLIHYILDQARLAPSGTNTQPWKVAVVSGKTKQELDKKLENEFLNHTPKQMDYTYYPTNLSSEFKRKRNECGLALYGQLGISQNDKDARIKQWLLNYSAFGAPTVLYFFAENIIEKGSYMDYGMFLQSIMLMAVSLGLATCPQASLAEYPQIVRAHLGYTNDQILICGMALGYEDTSAKINNYRTTRDEVDSFTQFFSS